MKLVVGLGNPGIEYARTRHNAGFMILERYAAQHGIGLRQERFFGRFGSGRIDSHTVALLLPLTFMNRSGDAVAAAVEGLLLDSPVDLVVVTDDLDLPLGRIRLRPSGGAGGHRGLVDIIDALGTREFARLRFGLGRPPQGEDPVAYVLRPFGETEMREVEAGIDDAVAALDFALDQGIGAAMNRFNRAPEPQTEGDSNPPPGSEPLE